MSSIKNKRDELSISRKIILSKFINRKLYLMKVCNSDGGMRRIGRRIGRSRNRNKDKNIDKNNSTNKNRFDLKVIEIITIATNRSMDQNTKKKIWAGK